MIFSKYWKAFKKWHNGKIREAVLFNVKKIPGFYVVLHTFGSDIKFNPHFHVLITAGGLRLDKKKWKSAPDNYLMPEAHLFYCTIGPQLC